MTRQSLSRLAQLPRASLTAFCSLAALSDNPGRPAAPTATAFHPDEASASLRATSSLASAAIEELLAARKTDRLQGGWQRDDEDIVDGHDQCKARRPGRRRIPDSARRVLDAVPADIENEVSARTDRDRFRFPARRINALEPALPGSRAIGVSFAANGFSVEVSCLIHGSGGIGGWPCGYTTVLPTA